MLQNELRGQHSHGKEETQPVSQSRRKTVSQGGWWIDGKRKGKVQPFYWLQLESTSEVRPTPQIVLRKK